MKTSLVDASPAIRCYFDLASAVLTAASMRCPETLPFPVTAGARTMRPVAALRPSTTIFGDFRVLESEFVATASM